MEIAPHNRAGRCCDLQFGVVPGRCAGTARARPTRNLGIPGSSLRDAPNDSDDNARVKQRDRGGTTAAFGQESQQQRTTLAPNSNVKFDQSSRFAEARLHVTIASFDGRAPMRLWFSIGAVMVAGVLAGGDAASVAAPGPRAATQAADKQAADKDGQAVDIELILAVDVSYSMDMDELAIQREGYAQAIQSKEFLQALKAGPNGRIAVTYFEWAASSDQKIIIPWRLIDGPETADAVAGEIMKTPIRRASRTSISGAITFAMPLFDEDPYRGLRRVIDISGDGPNNNGGPVTVARDMALEKGIIINGLPIMVKEPSYSTMDIDNLDYYYEDCVIGGPGSFVISIKDREKFKEAIRTKLLMEVAGRTPERPVVRVAEKEPRVSCMIGEKIWQDRWGR
jgi:hypothetical protein